MDEELSIASIIDQAGGPDAVATAAQNAGTKLSRWAIYKWPANGIPDQHWPLIMQLADVTADELLRANIAARTAEAAA